MNFLTLLALSVFASPLAQANDVAITCRIHEKEQKFLTEKQFTIADRHTIEAFRADGYVYSVMYYGDFAEGHDLIELSVRDEAKRSPTVRASAQWLNGKFDGKLNGLRSVRIDTEALEGGWSPFFLCTGAPEKAEEK
jgi:hypothetical protein